MTVAIRSDADIQLDVLAELDWDPEVEATEIGVEVEDGVVTLTGWVDSYAKRAAAERATQRVAGVRAVANDVVVKGHGTHTDADVARAVADALASNSLIPADRIKISVNRSRVTLKGEVDWDYQRQAAINTVRAVPGVQEVIDQITIKHRPVSVLAVKEAIERALIRSAGIDAQRIDVTVDDDGRVILQGTVKSMAEKLAAAAAAWRASGVTEVINEIEVRPM